MNFILSWVLHICNDIYLQTSLSNEICETWIRAIASESIILNLSFKMEFGVRKLQHYTAQ